MHQFQNKSRFSILAEDLVENRDFSKVETLERKQIYAQQENKTMNLFKKEYTEKNYSRMSNSEYLRTKEKEEFIHKATEMKRIEKERNETLSMNNFPELIVNKLNVNEQNIQNVTTFVNKVKLDFLISKKSDNTHSDINKRNEIIEPGWLKICKDSETNQIILKYGETDYKESKIEKKMVIESEKISEMEEKEIIHNTMIALVNLHKRRTEEYIELWGKDDWERYFLFSNDHYNYIDSDNEDDEYDVDFENYDDDYNSESE